MREGVRWSGKEKRGGKDGEGRERRTVMQE